MDGFETVEPRDVEEQQLLVQFACDFVVTEHLALQHRRPDTAGQGDHRGECNTCASSQKRALPSQSPIRSSLIGLPHLGPISKQHRKMLTHSFGLDTH